MRTTRRAGAGSVTCAPYRRAGRSPTTGRFPGRVGHSCVKLRRLGHPYRINGRTPDPEDRSMNTPPPYYGPGGMPPPRADNNQGLISMILGIVSIPALCCFYLGVPLAIAAIVLGVLGKQKADQGRATNRGQAIAGIACGAATLALTVVFVILGLVMRDFNPGDFQNF
ncbi:DUF4190 domain-containing protein [Actinoplanes sp. NEAU-H7]|uniref:DUF4190 domain-containing protein n=2 Tax=Actinoplanes flavus TaxID=2820290 RepID=A0ABS3UHG2_9ACTN|nr:DUF4190 domain-containing protein [Actinoplanes flavus]